MGVTVSRRVWLSCVVGAFGLQAMYQQNKYGRIHWGDAFDTGLFAADVASFGFTWKGLISRQAATGNEISEVANEGIYVVRNEAGEVYVGQSSDISKRLSEHVASGKFTQAEVDLAERIGVSGGKTTREIAEQLKLDSLGGRDASGVLNKVNPIGDRRTNLMPDGYVRP